MPAALQVQTGVRGGQYYLTASGRKVYGVPTKGGTGADAKLAKQHSAYAGDVSARANAGEVQHNTAARAHEDAAEQHRAAAAASRNQNYKRTHERLAQKHALQAQAHRQLHGLQQMQEPVPAKLSSSKAIPIRTVRSQFAEAQSKAVLSVTQHPVVAKLLQKFPLHEVTLNGPLDGHDKSGGTYLHKAPPPTKETAQLGRIHLNLQAKKMAADFVSKDAPGSMHSISESGKTPEERARITFAHELGHHLQFTTNSFQDAEQTHVRGNPLSKYGKKNPREYFAESFAAYMFRRADLKRHDPEGHAMIERAIQRSQRSR